MSSQMPVSVYRHKQPESLRNLNKDQALVPSPCSLFVTSYHSISHPDRDHKTEESQGGEGNEPEQDALGAWSHGSESTRNASRLPRGRVADD